MEKLWGESPDSGFRGNILSQNNWNDVIDALSLSEGYDLAIVGDSYTFDNGIRVEITSNDTDGDFLTVQVESDIETSRAPLYPTEGGTIYRNAEILLVDIDSDFTLLRSNGVAIPRGDYTIGEDGSFTFTTAQNDSFLMVDGLIYTTRHLITVTRDTSTKEITGFTIVDNTR